MKKQCIPTTTKQTTKKYKIKPTNKEKITSLTADRRCNQHTITTEVLGIFSLQMNCSLTTEAKNLETLLLAE